MRKTAPALLSAALALALVLAAPSEAPCLQQWVSLAAGIEYQHMAWELPDTGFGVEFHVLRVDPEVLSLRVLDARDFGLSRMTVQEMAQRTGALAVVNGGYFDTSEQPVGLVVRDGQVTSGLRRQDWGVLVLDGSRARIVHTRSYQRRKSTTQALQTGPRLVVRGQETTLKQTFTRRSAVGIDRAGRILLVAVQTIEPEAKTTLAELGAILRTPESEGGLGCLEALSLDGGGSTQMAANAAGRLVDVPGQWPVVTALGVFHPAAKLTSPEEIPTIQQLPTEVAPGEEAPSASSPPGRKSLPSILQPWE